MYTQKQAIQYTVDCLFHIIRMYDKLLDLFVLDFFIDNHWEKLPATWRACFQNMDPQTFGHIISGELTSHILPLSFLALLKSIEAYSLPRIRQNVVSIETAAKRNEVSEDTCATHPKLENLFLKHVKLKKRHEISLMADVVKDVAEKSNCEAVIDFGSGLGHLVRVLSYKNNLYSAGLESQSQLTEEARKLDLELEYTVEKCLSSKAMTKLRRPIHFNTTLSSHEQSLTIPLPITMQCYGLIGLHPCGDLGPLLLKHFANNKHVKFICVVGCCYMKLTCGGDRSMYPLSSYVQGLDHTLSYVSREIACHAIEVYAERLRKGNYEDLKVHAFRAALEKSLVEYNPKLKHSPVRSIKHTESMTFERYAELALERLDVPLPRPITSARAVELSQWRRVVLLYSLRLALAPLVETAVLLDRVLYVLENGFSCEICPVFDPKISPRNHIIIAHR